MTFLSIYHCIALPHRRCMFDRAVSLLFCSSSSVVRSSPTDDDDDLLGLLFVRRRPQ